MTAINLIPFPSAPLKAPLLQCDYSFSSFNSITLAGLNSYNVSFAHNLSTYSFGRRFFTGFSAVNHVWSESKPCVTEGLSIWHHIADEILWKHAQPC